MAKWNQLIITDAGYQLSALTLSGKQIQYTHAQTTDKDMSTMTSDQLKAVTKLDSVVQDLSVGIVSVQDDHTVNVPIKVTNHDVTADYLLCGLAIYAKPVNPDDGGEVLYGIAVAASPDLMVAQNGTTVVGTSFHLKVHVGAADNVNIVITPDGSVSNEELEGVLKSYVLASDLSKQLPPDIAKTGEANEFKEVNTFDKDPVNSDGKPYITAQTAKDSLTGGKDVAADTGDGGIMLAGKKVVPVPDNGDNTITVNGKTYVPVIDNKNGTITVAGMTFTPADEQHVITVNDAGTAEHANFDAGTLTIDKDLEVLGTVFFYENETTERDAFAKTHPHAGILTLSGDRPTADTGTTTGTDTSGTTTT